MKGLRCSNAALPNDPRGTWSEPAEERHAEQERWQLCDSVNIGDWASPSPGQGPLCARSSRRAKADLAHIGAAISAPRSRFGGSDRQTCRAEASLVADAVAFVLVVLCSEVDGH
jgi:hypothetical protein